MNCENNRIEPSRLCVPSNKYQSEKQMVITIAKMTKYFYFIFACSELKSQEHIYTYRFQHKMHECFLQMLYIKCAL